jgi:hypothetical protein
MKGSCLFALATTFVAIANISVDSATAGSGTNSANFIVFDAPGSVCKPAFAWCTQAVAINSRGDSTGTYADALDSLHGFLRKANGTITNFDIPGATCAGSYGLCTQPYAINSSGAITGMGCDSVTCHAFIRTYDGSFTIFDPPNSIISQGNAISDDGTVVGVWYDAAFVTHGFIRTRNGSFSTFDPPGSFNGINPSSISEEGTIAGDYYDLSWTTHGFVRKPDGSIYSFDPPGSTGTGAGINDEQVVFGGFSDSSFIGHGYFMFRPGNFKVFDVPNATFGTYPTGLTNSGVVTGIYQSNTGVHGFLRSSIGSYLSFDPPNSIFTLVTGINEDGTVVGWFDDNNFLQHGFIRLPCGGPCNDDHVGIIDDQKRATMGSNREHDIKKLLSRTRR